MWISAAADPFNERSPSLLPSEPRITIFRPRPIALATRSAFEGAASIAHSPFESMPLSTKRPSINNRYRSPLGSESPILTLTVSAPLSRAIRTQVLSAKSPSGAMDTASHARLLSHAAAQSLRKNCSPNVTGAAIAGIARSDPATTVRTKCKLMANSLSPTALLR